MVRKVICSLFLSLVVLTPILFASEQGEQDNVIIAPLDVEYRDVAVVRNEGGYYKKQRVGFHYGDDVIFKYNRVEMFQNEDGSSSTLSFDSVMFDEEVFAGFMFNDIIGLYIKMNVAVDIVTFNNNHYKINERLGIAGKIGPRIYYTSFAYVDAEFLFGRYMNTYNWSSYHMLGCDAGLGFELFSTPSMALDTKFTFSYRRTPYTNEFGAGLCLSAELF